MTDWTARGLKIERRQLLTAVAVLAILVLASYTRLTQLEVVEFKNDEAWASSKATAILEGKEFPLAGNISSLGPAQGPGLIYLMTLPYLLTRDPALATGFIGLLGVFAVLVCFCFTNRYFGIPAALAAALLFATSPWAVMYSRKIWEPNALPLLIGLFMSSLLAYAIERRDWQLILAFFWAALLPQSHILAAILWVPLAVAVALHRGRLPRRSLYGGLMVFGLIVAPYAIFTVANQGQHISLLARQTSMPWRWDFQSVTLAFESVGNAGPYVLKGTAIDTLYAVEGILFIGAMSYAVARLCFALRAKRTHQARSFGLLLLWLALPTALLSYHSAPVNPHYLLLIYPAQFIAIGIFVGDVYVAATRLRRAFRGAPGWLMSTTVRLALMSLLLAIGVQQVTDVNAFLKSVQNGEFDDSYGLPLKFAARAVDLAAAGPSNVDRPVLRLAGERNDFAKPFGYLSGNKFDIQFVDGRSPLVLPADGRFVYAAISDSSPAALLLDTAFPEGWLGVARNGGRVWGIYPIDPSETDRVLKAMALSTLVHAFPNGVELLGYRVPNTVRAGDVLQLAVVWRAPRTEGHATDDFSFFAHLVDNLAQRWGGIDAAAAVPDGPQAGDTVIQWLTLPVAPEATLAQYWVHFGVNQLAAANPTQKAARTLLGPIKVIPRDRLRREADAIIQTRQRVAFENQVELAGYDLSSNVARPGQSVRLTLHWLALDPDSDFTVFVHVVDHFGRIVAQADSQPGGGLYPTSMWDRGEYVLDQFQLDLPLDAAAGDYQLLVGMYQLESGKRLRASDGSGRVIGDAVELSSKLAVPH